MYIHVHFNYSPWQSESHTNASKPNSEQQQSDLVARKPGIPAPVLSASIDVVKSDQHRLGATWEGGKHQTRRYFTLYVPRYKHLEESTCKGAWWSWATRTPENAPKHRPWSQAKPTSCYSKMMYLQQGLHPRRITSIAISLALWEQKIISLLITIIAFTLPNRQSEVWGCWKKGRHQQQTQSLDK